MKNKFIYVTEKNIHGLMKNVHTLRAFKVSKRDGSSPTIAGNPILTCKTGVWLEVPNPDTNWMNNCAAGVNVGTYDWCRKEYDYELKYTDYILWEVEFNTDNVFCVPKHFAGKFRLDKCLVVRRVIRKPKALMPHYTLNRGL